MKTHLCEALEKPKLGKEYACLPACPNNSHQSTACGKTSGATSLHSCRKGAAAVQGLLGFNRLPSCVPATNQRMVRPYGMKGQKRKKRGERYDKEEDGAEEQTLETTTIAAKAAKMAKTENGGRKHEEEGGEGETGKEGAENVEFNEIEGIPIVPSDPKAEEQPRVIFVLEKASLEVAKVGKTYQILNSDDHANFLRKNNRNPAEYRPDIVYQALLAILDSPLNKAGRVRAVYVKTDKGILFEVKPHVRIPRTYKRFAGIMLQLLQKLSITAVGKREKLLRVIKNPVTQYLPVGAHKIGFSYSSEKLVQMKNYITAADNDADLVFVVGAMAHGKIECDYIDDFLAISGYPLSAAWCISRICEAAAEKWHVV